MAQPYHGGYHPTNDLSVILGQARAAEMIQAKLNQPDSFEIHPITGCLLSLTSLNNNGYAVGKRYSNDLLRQKAQNPGLDMRNKGTNILLHRAAYLALHGIDIAVGHVASHTCPFKACFKGEHIVSETQAQNLARINCAGVITCPHHDRIIIDLCNHDPLNLGQKCIKIHANIACCLHTVHPEETQPPAISDPSVTASDPSVEQILSQDPRTMPGSQFLGADLPDDEEDASDLPSDQPLQYSLPLGPPPSSPPLPSSSSRPGASSSSNQTLGHHPRPFSSSDIQRPRRRRRLQPLSSDEPPSDQPPSDHPPSGSKHGPQTSSSGLPTSDFVVDDDAPIEYESDESDEN
jgi:hypothetical protein